MIPEKTVGKLRQGWDSICFLLAPWWKYGKTLMVGSFISSVLFVPAAGYFSATLAQAVIEMIEAGKPFEAAFLTGLTYLLLALALDLLHAVYEDFYLRWKKQEIEGTIERSIYEKALMVDYRHFDDPSYFDSYKLATGEICLAVVGDAAKSLLAFERRREMHCLRRADRVAGRCAAAHRSGLLCVCRVCANLLEQGVRGA